MPEAFVAAFNTGDARVLDQLYEDRATLVPVPGEPVTGQGRLAANQHLISLGAPIRATLRHCYMVGELALLIVDWTVNGTWPVQRPTWSGAAPMGGGAT